jgi:hypothetical protein
VVRRGDGSQFAILFSNSQAGVLKYIDDREPATIALPELVAPPGRAARISRRWEEDDAATVSSRGIGLQARAIKSGCTTHTFARRMPEELANEMRENGAKSWEEIRQLL